MWHSEATHDIMYVSVLSSLATTYVHSWGGDIMM